MRIGIDIRALMEGKTTGVQVYITNLLQALFEIDQKNEYVLFANSFTPFLNPFPGRGNVKLKIFRYPNKLFIPSQKFLGYPKIDRLLGGVDLFFSPHWRTAALSRGIPLVVTFHDLSFEIMPEFFTLWKRMWHGFMDYRGAARRADKIIAVSESTKDDVVNLYGVPTEKIQVIYSGVERHEGNAAGLNPKDYFLYLGTFEPRKNILSVIEAYAQYRRQTPNPRPLVLAGARGWKVKMPKLAKDLRHCISIRQNVTDEEKSALYQHAFALLSLSFYEGFGFPLLEAAVRGVPVIASYATSHGEIGKDFAVFVNPLRPGQTAGGMLVLEQEPGLYSKLKGQGLAAAGEFTWEKTARETLELFQQVYEDRH